MIKANELRIGNLLDRENTGHSFEIAAEHLYYWDKFKDVLFPIPLTEEWLVKFGFARRISPEIFDIFVHKKGYTIYVNLDNIFTVAISRINSDVLPLPPHIKYVHQLQNLYFALTGEELTIK